MKIFKRFKTRRSTLSMDSDSPKPMLLEKLEPRILLSGDGLPGIDTIDSLPDCNQPVVQYVDLPEDNDQIETDQQIQPLLTLPLDEDCIHNEDEFAVNVIDSDGETADNEVDSDVAVVVENELTTRGDLCAPVLPGLHLIETATDNFEGQIVYLNFDGEQDVTYSGPAIIEDIDVPAFEAQGKFASQEEAIIADVLEDLNQIFAGSGIIFTTERPELDISYSTVYIGGDDSAFAEYGSFLGLAEQVDIGNQDLTDKSFVFSENIGALGSNLAEYSSILAGIAAHEIGHLLGYVHDNSVDGSLLSENFNDTFVIFSDDSDLKSYQISFIDVAMLFSGESIISTQANGAYMVYACDLDGDGDNDVLSASPGDDKIAWYENMGGGTFGGQQVISTLADGASSVYACDLDGDGDNDVLSASASDDKIAWYENMGGGSFGGQQVISMQANAAQSVYACDLDGDGDNDVLSASVYDDKIAWYENIGNGSFGGQTVISTQADMVYSVYACDLDGDGDNDVLSASYYDDKIAWYENTGGGTFGAQQVISTHADGAFSVYACDLDGDGDNDVLSASSGDDKIAWYENLGDGVFSGEQIISTQADWANSVFACDLDGDGDYDVLSASGGDGKVAFYENLGDGTFGSQHVISIQNSTRSVYACDLDGDGDNDVLSASVYNNKIAWYDNRTEFSRDITVLGNGQLIADDDITPDSSDHTDFGNVSVSGGSITRTFTIRNTGVEDLNLTGSPDRIIVEGSTDFTVTLQPATTVAANGGETTFEITFAPSSAGIKTATVSIANNSYTKNPYNFVVQGTYSPLSITTSSPLPVAVIDSVYSVIIEATGGAGPYTWSSIATSSDEYAESDPGPGVVSGGTAMGWRADDASYRLNLPWSFNYYGTDYTSVYVCTNGFLDFASSRTTYSNSTSGLISNVRIAPLWDDLRTDNGDIYVDTTNPDSVSIRWEGRTYHGGYPVDFMVTLNRNGTIRFDYGQMHSGLTPTIGISAGDGSHYVLSQRNGDSQIESNQASLFLMSGNYSLPPGLSLDSATGQISGTPTELGTFEFPIIVTDSNSPTGRFSMTFTLVVSDVAIEARLDNPAGGGVINMDTGYIDIEWIDYSGLGINTSTIDSSDISISGLTIGTPVDQGGGIWRYPYTGSLTEGDIDVIINAGAVQNNAGGWNLEQTFQFVYDSQGPTGSLNDPANGSVIYEDPGYIDVLWTDAGQSGIDTSSLDSNDITITGATIAGPPVSLGGGLYRYSYDATDLPEGTVIVTFVSGQVSDMAGNVNAGHQESFTYSPLSITTSSPLPVAVIDSPYSVIIESIGGAGPYTWSSIPASSDEYTESDPGAGIVSGGTAMGWRADDASYRLNLPWSFNYYGTDYTSVYVCTNGFLDFVSSSTTYSNSTSGLINNVRIAPLWDDLRTDNGNIYVDTTNPDSVSIRWEGRTYHGGYPVDFMVTLNRNGTIRFDYGQMHSGLTPTIGISAGDGSHYVLSQRNGDGQIESNQASLFSMAGDSLPPGLSLDSVTGQISGTPTELGTFEFPIIVMDSNSPTGQFSMTFTLVVSDVAIEAQLDNPATGSVVNIDTGYIDIEWIDYSGFGINISTIDSSDISISGLTIGTPVDQGDGIWRYPYTGSLTEGDIDVIINAGAVQNNAGNWNLEQTFQFVYDSQSPAGGLNDPTNGSVIYEDPGYIDVLWTDFGQSGIDTSSLDSNDITITGATIAGPPVSLGGGLYRYSHDATDLPEGTVIVTFVSGQVSDMAGNVNAGHQESFTYSPLSITTSSPLPMAVIDSPYSIIIEASGGAGPYTWSSIPSSSDEYVESDPGPGIVSGGTAMGWRADDASYRLNLPWSFNYYGTDYTSVYVCTNGFLDFASSSASYSNSTYQLISNIRIAPLWDDLRTDRGDIYVDTTNPDSVSIRWEGRMYFSGDPVDFMVTLNRNGTIRFDYGQMHTGLTPTIGISAGDGSHYVLSQHNGAGQIESNQASLFSLAGDSLPPGLSLDSFTGQISGTPTELGTFEFPIIVTDSNSPTGQISMTFTLVVGQAVIDARLEDPSTGSAVNVDTGYIDIDWIDYTGLGINTSTIDSSDISISGLTIGTPVDQGDGIWRYPYTGSLAEGNIDVIINADAVQNNAGNWNLEQTFQFIYDSQRPAGSLNDPANGSTINENRGYIDVLWTDAGQSGIDTSSLDSNDITITGATITGSPVSLGGGLYRYSYDATDLPEGTVIVTFVAGQVSDMAGNVSAGHQESFTYSPPTITYHNYHLVRIQTSLPTIGDYVGDDPVGDDGDVIAQRGVEQAWFCFDLTEIPDSEQIISVSFHARIRDFTEYYPTQRTLWYDPDDSWWNTEHHDPDLGGVKTVDELVSVILFNANGWTWTSFEIDISKHDWSDDLADNYVSLMVTGPLSGLYSAGEIDFREAYLELETMSITI